jgi:sugar phosphate isomerase/epimerase
MRDTQFADPIHPQASRKTFGSRRQMLALGGAAAVLGWAGPLTPGSLAAWLKIPAARLGICSFSCHQHWEAVRQGWEGVSFTDARTFYDYVRSLGADGVQTSLTAMDSEQALAFRAHCEATAGYYEGDLRLPKNETDCQRFEEEVRLTRLAGAEVARVTLAGRRYESWHSREEFLAFQAAAHQRLAWVEPIARKHRLTLAVENHKDHTAVELVALIQAISSEWIGITVDTGNNLALLEDPSRTIELLAPYAKTVHLKDMAVQPAEQGFLLSEVPCGQGLLDLPGIVSQLMKYNANLRFNLEMATRDPLQVPCLTEDYWKTFERRDDDGLNKFLAWVKRNPPRESPPGVADLNWQQRLAAEEKHNRLSLQWMHQRL